MAGPDKAAVIDQVREDLSNSAAILLTDYRGLTVKELAELRTELRKTGATYKVVKNTLARRAVAEAGLEGLEAALTGPTALTYCSDDPVGPAKALKAFAKTHPELVVKGGYLDGNVLDAAEAMQLAELDSREELLAKMAGLMYGALANTARLLQAPLSAMARVMGALEGKGGAPGAPASEPVAEQAPVAEAPASEEAPEAATEDAPVAEAEAPVEAAVDSTVEAAVEATDQTAVEATDEAAVEATNETVDEQE